LTASVLHFGVNYGVVLANAGRLGIIGVELYIAIWGAALMLGALYLQRLAPGGR